MPSTSAWARNQTGVILVAGDAPVTRIPDAADAPSPPLNLDLERSLRALALDLSQHGIGSGPLRKGDTNIEPLRDRNRKLTTSDRLDLEAVDGDELAIERESRSPSARPTAFTR